MRLVLEFREAKGETIMMSKHKRLSIQHASFNHLTVGQSNDTIIQLGYVLEGSSLQSLIMAIKSGNLATPGNLFHTTGQDWKGRYTYIYF